MTRPWNLNSMGRNTWAAKRSVDTRATKKRGAARVVPITVSRCAWKVKCRARLKSKRSEKVRSHKLRQGTDRSTETELSVMWPMLTHTDSNGRPHTLLHTENDLCVKAQAVTKTLLKKGCVYSLRSFRCGSRHGSSFSLLSFIVCGERGSNAVRRWHGVKLTVNFSIWRERRFLKDKH